MLVCALQTTIATSLFAQGILQQPQLPEPEAVGRFRLGFIRFTPSIVLTNLGVDTNVFNELVDPKDDFTVTSGPRRSSGAAWGRVGASMAARASTTSTSRSTTASARLAPPTWCGWTSTWGV